MREDELLLPLEDEEDVLVEDEELPEYPPPELVDLEDEPLPLLFTVDLVDELLFVERLVPELVVVRYRDWDETDDFLTVPDRRLVRPELLLLTEPDRVVR